MECEPCAVTSDNDQHQAFLMAQKLFDLVYALVLIGSLTWVWTTMLEELSLSGQLDGPSVIGMSLGALIGGVIMWRARPQFG